jgi:hypothetical protein
MAILWFGNANDLDSLKIKDLEDERLNQLVHQDQLVTRMRRAQDEYDGLFESANRPGLPVAERHIAIYNMESVDKRKKKAESELQVVAGQISKIDTFLEIFTLRDDLEKKGVWKTLNDLGEEELDEQITRLSKERKSATLKADRISEMLATNTPDPQVTRSAAFRRIEAELDRAREVENNGD